MDLIELPVNSDMLVNINLIVRVEVMRHRLFSSSTTFPISSLKIYGTGLKACLERMTILRIGLKLRRGTQEDLDYVSDVREQHFITL